MPGTMTFYFDFSSPYGFLASQKVGELAQSIGREIAWRPYLIGAVYKTHGGAPLEHPLKKAYMAKDFARSARLAGLPNARFPANFPASSVAPSRVLYWIERHAPEKVAPFAEGAFRAYWLEGNDVSDGSVAVKVATELGFNAEAVAAGVQEQEIKDRLRHITEDAMEHGVFGSPFIEIDGEPFWGFDRFDQIRELFGSQAGPDHERARG